MASILKDRSFYLAGVITAIFLAIGILFLIMGWVDYSWVLFLLLPCTIGIAIGALPDQRWAMIGALITLVLTLIFLQLMGLSGFICVIMCLPVIIPFMFLGAVITHLIRRYKMIQSGNVPILIMPLFLFMIAAPTDKYLNDDPMKAIEVRTEIVYPNYTPEQVYDAIKSVDTLDAAKPWLMHFDLPVPTKCILEKEEVGGIRTCYFKAGNMSNRDFGGGTIREKITALERGKLLQMDVTDYNLIGRKWLGFKEAIYYFDKVGDHGCKLTRVTTYTSVLNPRIYWEPLEKLGIRQEHDYVFNNLTKDLKKKYGNQ
jgi:hypothetical protein